VVVVVVAVAMSDAVALTGALFTALAGGVAGRGAVATTGGGVKGACVSWVAMPHTVAATSGSNHHQ
jgi:hypothetical protein